MSFRRDTIYALSSGGLPSGVAVVRISGGAAFEACTALVGTVPEARQATLLTIRARNNEFLDNALVLSFPGPRSFTGEDCVELHCHGGKAVVHAVLAELDGIPGLRHADAGEFSRRAFENGKLDLVEVEGLADLIAAETEMQRRLAAEQSSGGLSALYMGWADRLTNARAMIEAELDFADEDDVPGSVASTIWADMRLLATEMEHHLDRARAGEIIRDGLKIVIAGPPNAGKSSLMNALARRDVAIVTDIAGTTRDVLHIDLDLGGYNVRIYDTAGLRETDEVVEREGIRRALKVMDSADLILFLEEIGTTSVPRMADDGVPKLRIGTKLDRHRDLPRSDHDLCISVQTGEGMDELLGRILDEVRRYAPAESLAIPSRIRHVENLRKSLTYIHGALASVTVDLDLRAEELRLAASYLGKITGRVDVENLLDVIFSEFCIGK
ncbi:tRNA uridine-5-carboxymethylaminomethyl(34) synthesis GTPase MnmE [Rhizobiaceae bacterium n13]|uniref:tRNA modification GTPase MnmE n=1 Tax=Ferirhizobium litorale TaxID=2927786 RepID=A0AAE3QH46_9HYPH|nr:tRNA uridine-5-carboxymethylaminomethyl(34) synthesis GTPase MnmE [Fererhizobium litorale]MDI7863052.1 tRNA uridine-5-carboxymethylaminomethyl(34) synthesis GTPase MnmE [Fererhizobium litorale]MDI7923271.1 tRNA uridine-5-carboxymethylaminomethyl(34) synthesis GTPase MnmE [Fererhizobium litorale]